MTAAELETYALRANDVPHGWRSIPRIPAAPAGSLGIPTCNEANRLQFGSPSITRSWIVDNGRSGAFASEVIGSTRLASPGEARRDQVAAIELQRRCDAIVNRENQSQKQSCSTTSNSAGTSVIFSCSVGFTLVARAVPPADSAPSVGISGVVDSFRASHFGLQTVSYTILRDGVLATISLAGTRVMPEALAFVRAAAERL